MTAIAAAACGEVSAPVAWIEVTPARVSLAAGDSLALAARILDAAGSELRGRVSWASSDTGVAQVTATGVVLGTGEGDAVIRATFRNRVGAAAVTVARGALAAPGDTLLLSAERVVLVAEEAVRLEARLARADGDTVADVAVGWSSSDERVAVVSPDGVVTARAVGTATVAATEVRTGLVGTAAVSVAPLFQHVTAGSDHACGVTTEGEAFCWGHGEDGRLGNGDLIDHSAPVGVLVTGGVTFQALAAGLRHTCGLGADGSVLCWGGNDRGQLGIGTADQNAHPVRAPAVGNLTFTTVTAGANHTCGEAGGQVYCWGSGGTGQVVDLLVGDRAEPTAAGLMSTGVATGGSHTCALDAAGAVWCWGGNLQGQLGSDRQDGLRLADSVASPGPLDLWGGSFSNVVAVGTVPLRFCMESGLSLRQQGLLSETEPNNEPSTANPLNPGDTVVGRIDPAEDPDYFRVSVPAGDTVLFDIDAASIGSTSLDLRLLQEDERGVVVARSDDFDGLDPRLVAVATSAGALVIVLATGGDPDPSETYRLAVSTSPTDPCRPNVYQYDGVTWSGFVSANFDLHAVWGTSSTNVFAVGEGGNVLVSDGVGWSVQGTGNTARLRALWASGPGDVFAGGEFGRMTHFDGMQWVDQALPSARTVTGMWGSAPNDVWAVTSGGEILRYDGTSWALAAQFSAALFDVWGRAPDEVYAAGREILLRYDGANWMPFDNVPSARFQSVSGGPDSLVFAVGTEAIIGGGTESHLYVYRQDGWRTVASTAGEVSAVLALADDSVLIAGGAPDPGVEFQVPAIPGTILLYTAGGPEQVPAAPTFASLTAGGSHTCGVTPAGDALCWGGNDRGQLGIGSADGTAPPTQVAGGVQWEMVSAGSSHTCGVDGNGSVYCWGWNAFGEVGDGTYVERRTPVQVELPEPAVWVSAGAGYTCAVTERGVGYCWGDNEFGQLGDGTTEDRLTPVRIAGSR